MTAKKSLFGLLYVIVLPGKNKVRVLIIRQNEVEPFGCCDRYTGRIGMLQKWLLLNVHSVLAPSAAIQPTLAAPTFQILKKP
jgi:hypothetical protein